MTLQEYGINREKMNKNNSNTVSKLFSRKRQEVHQQFIKRRNIEKAHKQSQSSRQGQESELMQKQTIRYNPRH
jgi:hypothetical protein